MNRPLLERLWLSMMLLSLGSASGQSNVMPKENICGVHKDPKVNIICSPAKIIIKASKYTATEQLAGELYASKILWNSHLYLEYPVSGAFLFIQAVMYDLKTGKKVIDTAAGAVYFDQNLLVMLNTGDPGWQYLTNPVVYVYWKKKARLHTYPYILSARPGCKPRDDDLDVGVSDFRVTSTQFVFHRKDACGEFDVIKPFPKL